MNTFEKKMKQFRDALFGLAVWALVVLAFVFAAAGRATSTSALAREEAKIFEIKIDNFSFEPSAITVAAGTKVTWTNHDDVPHTVVNADGKFKSDALDTGDQFSFTFSEPGAYDYYCSVHPKMTGKVIVK
jgi:plastocyanin